MTLYSAASMAARLAAQASPEPASEGGLSGGTNADLIEELNRRYAEGGLDDDELGGSLFADRSEVIEDHEALVSAADWWRRGDKREALHFLEIALGRDFSGLGDLKPDQLT